MIFGSWVTGRHQTEPSRRSHSSDLSERLLSALPLTLPRVEQENGFGYLLGNTVHLEQCITLINTRTFMDDVTLCSAREHLKWTEEAECHKGDRCSKADVLLEQVRAEPPIISALTSVCTLPYLRPGPCRSPEVG
eukprot:6110616-Pyramimonas_sp.AAC.1